MVTIYPQTIIPHHSRGDRRYSGQCWNCGERSYYQGMGNPTFMCDPGPGVAYWGELNVSYPYSDAITTWSGSYNMPTPFTASNWNIDPNIRGNAVVKKIVVEYSIAPAQYSGHEKGIFYMHELSSEARAVDAEGESKGQRIKACQNNTPNIYGQSPYKIILSGFGDNKDTSGQGLSSHNTVPNRAEYPSLSEYSSVLYEGYDKNLTINVLKNSQLTFILPRNLNHDISRIVMKYVRLRVEYEDIPPVVQINTQSITPPPSASFQIDNQSITEVTTCPDQFALYTLQIKSTNNVTDTTKIKISGTALTHAKTVDLYVNPEIGATGKGERDTWEKNEDNTYTWTVVDFAKDNMATLQLKLTYEYAGVYNAIATLVTNRDSQNYTKTDTIKVKPCKPNINFYFLDNDGNDMPHPYVYTDTDNTKGCFKIVINRNQIFDDNEEILISMDDLGFENLEKPDNAELKYEDGFYIISNIKDEEDITIKFDTHFNVSGLYNIQIFYRNYDKQTWNTTKTYEITIKGSILPKEYFKLRLEDGTDVRYNSLMFTQGDDLVKPLVYNTNDIKDYIDKIKITGEFKRIPVNEAQYIYFDIDFDIDEDITLERVLTYIEIDTVDNNADDIIIGASRNVSLLEMESDKICSIESIKSNETTRIKFAVKSEVEIEDVQIKIKPHNYDEQYTNGDWLPAHIMFKDIPNVKISIDGKSDIMCSNYNDDNEDCYFWLYYHIQNLSNAVGKNVRFQLKEPTQFRKVEDIFDAENVENSNAPYFNRNNRIITFPVLEANSAEYILAVKYKATKKGFYKFIIHTLDSENTLNDDQYANSYEHEVMVNITSDVRIKTFVSDVHPYINDMIDFNINVLNKYKKQEYFTFDIYDIGSYDINHSDNHYKIEYENYENGVFTPADSNNKIGHWRLDNIDIDDEYDLTLSMRPQDIGNHIIKTVFTDYQGNTKEFYNEVKVFDRKKQIDFNVYHAINEDENGNCSNCDSLIKICDDDFINLKDDIYYVFEIKNNNREPITNAIHIYARLPKSFLDNGILCSSYHYEINEQNGLISFNIPKIQSCEHEDSLIKFCIKVKPSEVGSYISNFSLSTRNARVLHKKLTLTVDTEFNDRKTEHEITIYNFDKTNKYYRYEVDNVGDIFKFYNTGDKSYRMIDIENFNRGSIETYKGTNLREILKDIERTSKYVEPLFFKYGNNHIADQAHELYPDGLMRRFGLLNSEVYHYSHQLPKTTNLVDRAMIWDVDKWDTKVWAGGKYDNGVFDLTIDYNKVPSNFNILDIKNPVKNLQALVDNVKPYGTKAICYYSATLEASMAIRADSVSTTVNHNIHVPIYLPDDFDIFSLYNRHDNTIVGNYELSKLSIKPIINEIKTEGIVKDKNSIGIGSGEIITSVYVDKMPKIYASECYDLISNSYNANGIEKNIDITKPYDINEYDTTIQNNGITIVNCIGKLLNKESIDLSIYSSKGGVYIHGNTDDSEELDDNIYFSFVRDDINDFMGFRITYKDRIIQERNIFDNINNFSLQVQRIKKGHNVTLHFWGSVNNEKYYHIGYMLLNRAFSPTIKVINNATACEPHKSTIGKDACVSFQISDKVKTLNKDFNIIKGIEGKNKWSYLSNINKKHNKYAQFENRIDIDKACDTQKINVPKLVLKYDDFNINHLDEIVDVKFKIKAQSNKEDFEKDININLFKDADAYIPSDNRGRQIVYPESINNVNQEFLTTITMEQPNITICSNCLKTELGYNDTCSHCGSPHVLHYNEKKPVTACYNCNWIIDGWHDYCHHCLSYNIEKTKVDFNKTYCNDCRKISEKYYEYCPYCFSKNVTHLTNNIKRYKLFDDNIQNIEPVHIKVDEKNINIFNLEIPLNKRIAELNRIDTLSLKIDGTDNNDGRYYYCEACEHGGIGNYDECPYCNSNLVHNYQADNSVIETYLRTNENSIVSVDNISNDFEVVIDLKKYALENNDDSFGLLFYAENKKYDETLNNILELPIDDEEKADIIDAVIPLNFVINNISLASKYLNEQEWVGLDKLEGQNHTGVKYYVPANASTVDAISFNNFNVDAGNYEHAFLYLTGFVKHTGANIDSLVMNVEITNGDEVKNEYVTIRDDLFSVNLDIIKILSSSYLKDVSIQVSFINTEDIESILITNCNMTVEKIQYDDIIHDDVNLINSEVIKESNDLLFSSINDLWGLNSTKPHYMSGKQLDTGLICYIDCGKLDLQEYIRIYDIDMIIYYKAKSGKITTEVIPSRENALAKHKVSSFEGFDEDATEQLLSAKVNKVNGELLGSINLPYTVLNNLEYNLSTVNDDFINSIPLRNRIAQAFTIDTTTVSSVDINYYGKSGYPSEIISAFLCKDKDGRPGSVIESSEVFIPVSSNNVINIDFNAYNLESNKQYWIVLEDNSANKNNYHKFKYNNNPVGELLIYNGDTIMHENSATLSFNVNSIKKSDAFNSLPKTYSFNDNIFDGYKIHYILYRYNVNDINNVIMSKMNIKSGYKIRD